MDFQVWLAFCAVWAAAMVGVGANMIVCVTAGTANGFSRGVWAAIGMMPASSIHSMIASFGLSAFVLGSPVAFHALSWVGAIYLIGLGLRLWRQAPLDFAGLEAGFESRIQLFRRGFLVSLCNPQSYAWYLIFFAPFIDQSRALLPQISVLAPTSVVIAFAGFVIYTGLGQQLRRFLTTPGRVRILNRISGAFLVLVGIGVAMSSVRGIDGTTGDLTDASGSEFAQPS